MTKSRKTSTQPEYVLVAPTAADYRHRTSSHTFLRGGGKLNYQFPKLRTLVRRALKNGRKADFVMPAAVITKHGDHDAGVLCQLNPLAFPTQPAMAFVKAAAPKQKVTSERALGHDMAQAMIADLFTQPVYDFFAPDFNTLNAKTLLPREYWEIADSLKAQLEPARDQVLAALPQVMTGLKKHYPEASTGQLYQAALQLIGRELAPILSTVQLWTTGFRQLLDPALQPLLTLARAIVESGLFLTLTGNAKIDQINGPIKQQIATIDVSVGDVVLVVLTGPFESGPAVIPMADGALGPRGGHLAFLPRNLAALLPFIISIYMHETGHLLQGVIKNFMKTYAKLIADTIASRVADGTLVFDEAFVMLGTQKVPADKFWTMVFQGQLPELNADHWGELISGPGAFGRCFATYVTAMTEVGHGSLDGVPNVLRTGSSYKLVKTEDGKVGLKLEPHPQDSVRIGAWQAAIARKMGYPEVAKYLEQYAASESGKDADRITWVGQMPKGEDDEQGLVRGSGSSRRRKPSAQPKPAPKADDGEGDESDSGKAGKQGDAPKQPQLPTISASAADFKKVADALVEAFDTPVACLNGMSLSQLVNLTPKMQTEKVNPLKDLLKKGVAQLPADGRHYFFHTVGSAAVLALSELVDEGMDATKAREQVGTAALSMMNELLPVWLKAVKDLNIYRLTDEEVQPDPKS